MGYIVKQEKTYDKGSYLVYSSNERVLCRYNMYPDHVFIENDPYIEYNGSGYVFKEETGSIWSSTGSKTLQGGSYFSFQYFNTDIYRFEHTGIFKAITSVTLKTSDNLTFEITSGTVATLGIYPSGNTLGDVPVGTRVSLPIKSSENWQDSYFYVYHQGKPSSDYDNSCNGTWLCKTLIVGSNESTDYNYWGTGYAYYPKSKLNTYLNNYLKNKLSNGIYPAVKLVKIPYYSNYNSSGVLEDKVYTLDQGFETRAFSLSATELGFTPSDNSMVKIVGAKLDIFKLPNVDSVYTYPNGDTGVWLRDPESSSSSLRLPYASPRELEDTQINYSKKHWYALVFIMDSTVKIDSEYDPDIGSQIYKVLPNSVPTAPATITIPNSVISDTSFLVSWSSSTDSDNNLVGYILERSIDSGFSWKQIYQGSLTSYTDTVPSGTSSVTYRVKAYDSYNAESAYKTSNTVGVVNNRPPDSPLSITIPELVLGGQPSLIEWEASNDVDQNLVGYELERQLNNTGGFTRIYKGSELQYTDTVDKGTLQVQYRVRAYDSYNAYSEYTTSSLKEVNNNTLPTITGEDTDLGTLESVSYRYTVTDPDEGQTLNVTEYIDSKIHRTLTVTSGVENTLTIDGEEFLQVGKGSHTIVISVDDGQGILVKRTLTFTRVQNKLSTTLITPLPANEMPTRMYAFIIGNIPTEAVFHFYACNNALDVEPTWQEVTDEVLMKKKFYFTNKTKTADQWGVNIKFEVDRSTVPEGTEIYISKVSGGFDGYSTQS